MSSTGKSPTKPPPAEKNSTPARAHARRKPRAKGAPPKSERVRIFRKLMIAQRFITGHTVAEYAKKWDMAEQTLRLDSAEASRSFEETDEERATAKSRWLATVQGAAMNARKVGQLGAEARFLELQARAQSFLEPHKVEISGSLGQLLALATDSSSEDPEEPVGE